MGRMPVFAAAAVGEQDLGAGAADGVCYLLCQTVFVVSEWEELVIQANRWIDILHQ